MRKISKLLIANRGEIALRIMRTAKEMGIQTVAVYSDADVKAPHVRFADDVVYIGLSAADSSYLNPEKIIEAAKISGSDSIHPGYGFLSENAEFARLVQEEGLIFVGPDHHAINIMGDKAISKRAMIDAGIPCLPGYQGSDQSDEILIAEAKKIGFPLMVKAAAGGGGIGMRRIDCLSELSNSIHMARLEAKKTFGFGALILERAINRPRHVEIQLLADSFGHIVHFAERDCSVQRRHQKVIEEAPCPVMIPELRAKMGNAAIGVAKAVNYIGAGTVEFLLDKEGTFYFLEMNTRLQVEHPVTEMITGHDLVALQLKIAQGESLDLKQSDIKLQGHAIEVRLYAEDPDDDFLPCAGPVTQWIEPSFSGIRVDSGIESGSVVTPFYDPMLAKIISHGSCREEARRKLIKALDNTALFGIKTNRDFLIAALKNEQFINGKSTTGFIAENFTRTPIQNKNIDENIYTNCAIAAVIQHISAMRHYQSVASNVSSELLDWSSVAVLQSLRCYEINGHQLIISIYSPDKAGGAYRVSLLEHEINITVLEITTDRAKLIVNGRTVSAIFCIEDEKLIHIAISGATIFKLTNIIAGVENINIDSTASIIRAPMHGVIIGIEVTEGDEVKKGQRLVVLEAMKMQHSILAPIDGSVQTLNVKADEQIATDDILLEIEN
ncbi:biotin carboxylase N-terminal domain-containing protein [Microbulbifer sp. 2205BS26-8]|uniref:acetyl/propionyl/methylcrotonyl-CoA carboxylase subunit alpha n=1 Tax=Microbulbifer sp. 2205BS26-8 TaxID=3064386 RepID=UPI00273DAE38|nr:biotin carboxylase N-terminal domain-containing protein [Microbulbifer sp. 2205BS26-8]MDP5209277.1 biotin carboxylase N-terminal domain-containing protein [Microbulbifer sp. 2205BS26-8]